VDRGFDLYYSDGQVTASLSGEVVFPAPPSVLTLGLERATEPLLSFGGGSPTLSSRSRD
jgi:hypothetical protein